MCHCVPRTASICSCGIRFPWAAAPSAPAAADVMSATRASSAWELQADAWASAAALHHHWLICNMMQHVLVALFDPMLGELSTWCDGSDDSSEAGSTHREVGLSGIHACSSYRRAHIPALPTPAHSVARHRSAVCAAHANSWDSFMGPSHFAHAAGIRAEPLRCSSALRASLTLCRRTVSRAGSEEVAIMGVATVDVHRADRGRPY